MPRAELYSNAVHLQCSFTWYSLFAVYKLVNPLLICCVKLEKCLQTPHIAKSLTRIESSSHQDYRMTVNPSLPIRIHCQMLRGLINIGLYSSHIPFQLLQEHAYEMISHRKWLEEPHLQPHSRSDMHAWFDSSTWIYHSETKNTQLTRPTGQLKFAPGSASSIWTWLMHEDNTGTLQNKGNKRVK